MSSSVYITAMEPRAAKAVVALGLLDLLVRRVDRVAIFRPVVSEAPDPITELLLAQQHLDQDTADTFGCTYAELDELGTSDGGLQALVVEHVAKLRKEFDFVLCIGTDFRGPSPGTEFELNASLAADLGAPVINVVSAQGRSADTAASAVATARRVLSGRGCSVVATIVNRVPPALGESLLAALGNAAGDAPVYCLRELPVLSALTMEEVRLALDGTLLSGAELSLQREITGYVAGSGHLDTVLPLLAEGSLLVTSGDRTDLAVGAAAAAASRLPTPGGIVLTCGHRPSPLVQTLLEPCGVPVIAVAQDTYTALHALDGLRGQIRPTSVRKIAAALGEFAAAVDGDELARLISLDRPVAVTPRMFSYRLLERARENLQHIVLPEGLDDRVLRAAEELVHLRVAHLTLLGDPAAVRQRAVVLGLDLGPTAIVDPVTSPLREEFSGVYAALRAHRGMTADAAHDIVADANYFGALLVHLGRVDGMVSGAAHSTAATLRPALEIVRTAPDTSLVSSAFFICLPDKVLVFADCAVVPDPDAGQLADIALATAKTAAAFGIEPRVALISYSTGTSGSGIDVEKVQQAARLVAERRPDLPLVGPIQYDAAVVPSVAASKMPGNAIAGRANVLIFPDLNTGNTTYKAVQRSSGAVAVGPVLQGLAKPVNDLSRGCTVRDIIDTVAITAIQAQDRG